jgi:hypothetical protein
MEQSPKQQEKQQPQEDAPCSVESSANFEGNHSLLLFSRVRNPFIQEQLIDLLYEEELDHAKRGDTTVAYDEHGNIISISRDEVKMVHKEYTPRSKKEILEDFYTRLKTVETDTPISYDPREVPRVTAREQSPIFSYNNLTDDEIVSIIKKSLETNERIKEEYLEDATY